MFNSMRFLNREKGDSNPVARPSQIYDKISISEK